MKIYNFTKVGAYIFIDVFEQGAKNMMIESIEFPMSNSRINSVFGSVTKKPEVEYPFEDGVRNPLLTDETASGTASEIGTILNSTIERIGVSILSNNLNLITIQKGQEEETSFEQEILDENGEFTGETEIVTETSFVENEFIVDEVSIGFEQLVFDYLANNTGFAITSPFKTSLDEIGAEIPKAQF